VCYPTLQNINAKEARKAMNRAQLKKAKEKPKGLNWFEKDSVIHSFNE